MIVNMGYQSDNEERSGKRRSKRRRSPRRKVFIIVVVLLIIVVGGAFTAEFTSQSSFCKSCHVMQDFHKTWSTSSHKSVDCIDCHSQPGIVGYAKAKANGLRQVWVNFTSDIDPKDIRAASRDINCESCHQDKPRSNLTQAAVAKDPHSAAHFTDMTCVTCHTGLTHDESLNTSRPSRDTCFRCHLTDMDL